MCPCGSDAWNAIWRKEGLLVDEDIESDGIFRVLKRTSWHRRYRTILEAGCGSGLRTLFFAKKHGVQAFLLDFSKEALKRAKEGCCMLNIDANIILGDVRKLPFRNRNFDIVWNEGVNEHFKGKFRQKVFNEMTRVCNTEGKVIVIVPNSLNLFYILKKILDEILGKWMFGFEKPFTPSELGRRMENAQLRILRYDGTGETGLLFLPFIERAWQKRRSLVLKSNSNKKPYYKVIKAIINIFHSNFINRWFAREIAVEGFKY